MSQQNVIVRQVQVYANGAVEFIEHRPGAGGAGFEGDSLEGVEFRCSPAGQAGCP